LSRLLLVTGGLGYIGSHTCVALAEAGYEFVILDNLANSKIAVLDRLKELIGSEVMFTRADVRDRAALETIFKARRFDAVLHFAGLKSVAESVANPQLYQDINVGGSRMLLDAMRAHGVRQIIFSSSATVYGEPDFLPLTEDHPLRPANPYGETKLAVEHLLAAEAAADSSFLYACLRYFNPIGAHPSGRIGEDPQGAPENLLPYVAQVAVGRRPTLLVFGNDYDTPDGTGVRDYLHVTDLASGHIAALDYVARNNRSITVNLGTGRGHSVMEVVKAFERASGKAIAVEVRGRRPGDVGSSYADCSLAARELRWKARFSMDDMCRDAWRWQKGNPQGYPASRN
jgi:UDP-glucose 4-epimerase